MKGSMVADELLLAELSVNWMRNPTEVRARAAFVNSKTGATHAWTDSGGIQWSESTQKALDALRQSMESDLARVHLRGRGDVTSGGEQGLNIEDQKGIGEHLGTADDETPSI